MYAVRPVDPVKEEQAVGVVDFVLQRHGLETVGSDLHPLAGQRQLTSNHKALTPGHIPGEVGNRHAALTTPLAARRADNHCVAQGEQTVTRARLDMTRDVEAEHPGGHTDLLGGQSDATRGDQLGGKQIGDELNRGGLARVDI